MNGKFSKVLLNALIVFWFLYFSPFSLIYIFAMIYSEVYFSIVCCCLIKSFLFRDWLIYCSSIYFSFLFISTVTATLLTLKVYFVCSIIIGNFIDIYLFGLLAVLIHWFFQVISFGWLLYSFLLYLFLHRLEIFLLVISLLEYFSSFFQSLTLSNRISINLLSGSLLIELLSVLFYFLLTFNSFIVLGSRNYSCFIFGISITRFLFFLWFTIFLLFIIFTFELGNSFIQLIIFCILHLNLIFIDF